MSQENLERMIKLAEEFFETKNDPTQISVDEQVMELLKRIHPRTMSEASTPKGPVAWVLLIPTTDQLMHLFISKKISERELLFQTPVGGLFTAVYLCSALVLPEYRGRGLAKKLAQEALASIMAEHPIGHLFFWRFSNEGENLAKTIAESFHLPLLLRTD